jgi:hypothetical protein
MPRRHSKQTGGIGSEGLTYHERRALGYGTARERLGAVSEVLVGRAAHPAAAPRAARRRPTPLRALSLKQARTLPQPKPNNDNNNNNRTQSATSTSAA